RFCCNARRGWGNRAPCYVRSHRACRSVVLSPNTGQGRTALRQPRIRSGDERKRGKCMGEMIRMTMDDGAEIAVYHAQPEGERRGGLVLIQEIFGVTDHIRELCDEYAADGYEVLAPA